MVHVLVVDANAAFTRSLQILLEDEGHHEVRRAHSAAEARGELARAPKVEVLLSDLSLPDGDALGLVEEVDLTGRPLTVIVMTADRAMCQLLETTAEGSVKVLCKPVDPQQLLELIAAASTRVRR